MNEKNSKASITGMRQGYSEYAVSQHNAISNGIDTAISRLINSFQVDQSGHEYINLVDLGCADGVNSFPVVEQFANALYQHINPLNLMVSHVDIPTADFNGLAQNIYQHPSSYRQTVSKQAINIRTAFIPGSFYAPFLPENSVDIIFSTTALHYASKTASILTQHVHPLCATEGQELSAWQQLSALDMDAALNNIHSCMKPGGKLWAVVPSHSIDHSSGKINNYWYREVLDVMNEQLIQLVDQGLVSDERWNNFVFPVHQRHVNQWQQWFSDNHAMFDVDFLYAEEQENPYLQKFKTAHQDVNRFADDYLSSVRAWSDQIIKHLLPDNEQRNLFFEGLRKQFIQEPDRFENDTLSVYIGVTRK